MPKDEMHKKLQELHSKMDTDKNGAVNQQEFVKFLKGLMMKMVPPGLPAAVMK